MLRNPIYAREELYDRIVEAVLDLLGDTVAAIILFGSTVYMGEGRDVDLLIIVDRGVDAKGKVRLEYEVSRRLASMARGVVFDVHVMGLDSFRENLVPGGFLSGLALGYEVLLDRRGVEREIECFLEALAEEEIVLHNQYGAWNLGFHAKLTLRLRKRREGHKLKHYALGRRSQQ